MKIAVTYENGQIFQHFAHRTFQSFMKLWTAKSLMRKLFDTNGSGHGALAGFLMQHGGTLRSAEHRRRCVRHSPKGDQALTAVSATLTRR